MDLLKSTMQALDIKNSPTFEDVVKNISVSLNSTRPNVQGMLKEGNINIYSRPKVKLSDGSTATVRSMSVSDSSGREILLPTIGPNGEDWTAKQAIDNWRRTGDNLGTFQDQESADKYAQELHEQQDRLYVSGEEVNNGNTK